MGGGSGGGSSGGMSAVSIGGSIGSSIGIGSMGDSYGGGYYSDANAPAGTIVSNGAVTIPGSQAGRDLDNLNAMAYQMMYGQSPDGLPPGIGLLPSGDAYGYLSPADRAKAMSDAISVRSVLGDWGMTDKIGHYLVTKGIPYAAKIGTSLMPGVGATNLTSAILGLAAQNLFGEGAEYLAKRVGDSLGYQMASGNWGSASPNASLSPMHQGIDTPSYMRTYNDGSGSLIPGLSTLRSIGASYGPRDGATRSIGGLSDIDYQNLATTGMAGTSGIPENGFLTSYGVITPEIYEKLLDVGATNVPFGKEYANTQNAGSPIGFRSANFDNAAPSEDVLGGLGKDQYDLYRARRDALLRVKDDLGLDVSDIYYDRSSLDVPAETGFDVLEKGSPQTSTIGREEERLLAADSMYREIMNQLGHPIAKFNPGKHPGSWNSLFSGKKADMYGWVGDYNQFMGDPATVEPVFIMGDNGYVLNPKYKTNISPVVSRSTGVQGTQNNASIQPMGTQSGYVPTYSRRQSMGVTPSQSKTKIK